MDSPWLRFLVAFAAAVLLTPAARYLAQRAGAIDRPDGRRKLQKRPVPLFGGVAVYLAMVFTLLVTTSDTFGAPDAFVRMAGVVVAVAGFVCAFGCIDDVWDLSARFKLLLQIAAASVVVFAGYSIDRVVVFGMPIELGWFGVVLTICWLVGCINALNLLDGMDGLASVVGLFTAMMMATIATISGHEHVAMIAFVLAGALAGFLVFNLPPASIYLGDSGSMVIGLIVGVLGMQASLKTTATLSITAPAVIMAIPILDATYAVIRRKLSGQRFDAADRGHIHHRLLDRGFSPWQALCLIGALCLMTGTAATASTIFHNDLLAWTTALMLVGMLMVTRLFGHHELSLAKISVAGTLAGWVGKWAASHRVAGELSRHKSLATRPFAEMWSLLLAEVQGYKIQELELTYVSAEGDYLRQEFWRSDDGNEQAADAVLNIEDRLRLALEAPARPVLSRRDAVPVESTAEPVQPQQAWRVELGYACSEAGQVLLRVTGQMSDQPEPVDMLILASRLKFFGEHWAAHPDTLPQLEPDTEAAYPRIIPWRQRRAA